MNNIQMVKQKIVGQIPASKAAFYCDSGKLPARRIGYAVNRTIAPQVKQLVKPKNKCVKYAVSGKTVTLQCESCIPQSRKCVQVKE